MKNGTSDCTHVVRLKKMTQGLTAKRKAASRPVRRPSVSVAARQTNHEAELLSSSTKPCTAHGLRHRSSGSAWR